MKGTVTIHPAVLDDDEDADAIEVLLDHAMSIVTRGRTMPEIYAHSFYEGMVANALRSSRYTWTSAEEQLGASVERLFERAGNVLLGEEVTP